MVFGITIGCVFSYRYFKVHWEHSIWDKLHCPLWQALASKFRKPWPLKKISAFQKQISILSNYIYLTCNFTSKTNKWPQILYLLVNYDRQWESKYTKMEKTGWNFKVKSFSIYILGFVWISLLVALFGYFLMICIWYNYLL